MSRAIAHRVEGLIGPDAELVELVWMPITEARHLDMPAITAVVLEELQERIAAGMSHDLPVPFYQMLHRVRAGDPVTSAMRRESGPAQARALS